MNHRATSRFWKCYYGLPESVRELADRCYLQLLQNPSHPSLRFREVGSFWSVRVGLHYRALAVRDGDDVIWFWIGTHAEYDTLLGR